MYSWKKQSVAFNDNPHDLSNLRNIPSFGGYFANGGVVAQGKPIMVGERGAEVFVPKASQQKGSLPQSTRENRDSIVVNIHVSTPDATTFRRSQGQIMAEAAAAMQRARRNL